MDYNTDHSVNPYVATFTVMYLHFPVIYKQPVNWLKDQSLIVSIQ